MSARKSACGEVLSERQLSALLSNRQLIKLAGK
jgi:hypothetical protein